MVLSSFSRCCCLEDSAAFIARVIRTSCTGMLDCRPRRVFFLDIGQSWKVKE